MYGTSWGDVGNALPVLSAVATAPGVTAVSKKIKFPPKQENPLANENNPIRSGKPPNTSSNANKNPS